MYFMYYAYYMHYMYYISHLYHLYHSYHFYHVYHLWYLYHLLAVLEKDPSGSKVLAMWKNTIKAGGSTAICKMLTGVGDGVDTP